MIHISSYYTIYIAFSYLTSLTVLEILCFFRKQQNPTNYQCYIKALNECYGMVHYMFPLRNNSFKKYDEISLLSQINLLHYIEVVK